MTSGLLRGVLISGGVSIVKLKFQLFIYSKLCSVSVLNVCLRWDFSKLAIYAASHFYMIVSVHYINAQIWVSSSFNLAVLRELTRLQAPSVRDTCICKRHRTGVESIKDQSSLRESGLFIGWVHEYNR